MEFTNVKENFCSAIGHSDWLRESKFSTLKNRKANEEELNRLVEDLTVQYTAEQLMLLMQKSGIAAGIVKNSKDLSEDPQLRDRDFFWFMEHPELGKFTHLGEPAILSKTPAKPYRPAPCLGEHTDYICKELLGMTEDEFTNHVTSDTFGF
jgi:benzylsuccinate CoA-transferase BbsF subunit